MLYRGRRYINTVFVSVFRQLFTNHPQFPWLPEFLKTKIYIDESYPRSERKFPEIICTDVTDGQFFQSSFDRNFQEDVYDNEENLVGSVHGMTIFPTIRISISTLSKFDCEIIADYICSYMQYYGVNKFADVGIYILSATGSIPQTENYGKELIYTVDLNYNLQAEWQKFIPFNDELIEKVVIPDINIIYPPGNIEHHTGEVVRIEKDKEDDPSN